MATDLLKDLRTSLFQSEVRVPIESLQVPQALHSLTSSHLWGPQQPFQLPMMTEGT
jgi:hypothetical protein